MLGRESWAGVIGRDGSCTETIQGVVASDSQTGRKAKQNEKRARAPCARQLGDVLGRSTDLPDLIATIFKQVTDLVYGPSQKSASRDGLRAASIFVKTPKPSPINVCDRGTNRIKELTNSKRLCEDFLQRTSYPNGRRRLPKSSV
jgi:hypothetical protein